MYMKVYIFNFAFYHKKKGHRVVKGRGLLVPVGVLIVRNEMLLKLNLI